MSATPSYVCAACIGDEVLREEVLAEETCGVCLHCSKRGKAISLEALAERIREVIEEHFYLAPNEPSGYEYSLATEGDWYRDGFPVLNVIADAAGLDEGLAESVREFLSDRYGHASIKDGEENAFAVDAQYDQQSPNDDHFHTAWKSFCEQIRWRSRYFNPNAASELDSIFGELETLKIAGGGSVLRTYPAYDKDFTLYRARVALTPLELQEILKYPASQLGAPPPALARSGRMNAVGISVFYGASDPVTCVAEIRPPVGSHVVLGQFELSRQVSLLDLDALGRIYVQTSHFDPDYGLHQARAAFLRQLVHEISRPVMPGDENFDYLPTQFIAEYLAAKKTPKLDGIVFSSSQTGGSGQNVVLFNEASAAAPDAMPPGSSFEFMMRVSSDDEEDPVIAIFEDAQASSCAPNPSRHEAPATDYQTPTLKLLEDSVRVADIRAASYEFGQRPVLRIRNKRDTGY